MAKKGQVSLFIIAGIAIVIIIAVVLYWRSQIKNLSDEGLDVAPLQTYVQECADMTAKDAVIYISKEGGYLGDLDLSAFYPSYADERIPVWYLPGKDNTPSKEFVEGEITQYFNEGLYGCTWGFEPFEKQGMDVNAGFPETTVTITRDSVIFIINYPLIIKKEGETARLSEFSSNVDAELLDMLEVANKFVRIQNETPYGLPISELTELAWENNLTFTIEYFEEGNIITLINNNSMLGTPYEFSFAVAYNASFLEGR